MRSSAAPANDLDAKLGAVLDAFAGNAEQAARALTELSHRRQRQQLPDRTYGPVVIELQNVSRQYKLGPNRIGAVRDLSLQIRQGELVAITGPSGSGKVGRVGAHGARRSWPTWLRFGGSPSGWRLQRCGREYG